MLVLWYVLKTGVRSNIFLLALTFSFFGDVFLLSEEASAFIAGLSSFLIAHYARRSSKSVLIEFNMKKWLLCLLPFLLLLASLVTLTLNDLGSFLIPVIVYGLAISLMGSLSLKLFLSKKNGIHAIALTAAVTFVFSDSMIAVNKFHLQHESYSAVIIGSYGIAQMLFVLFMLKKEEEKLLTA